MDRERDEQVPKMKLRVSIQPVENTEAVEKPHELRSGELCPQCQQGRLDYDGLLNLSCPHCGFAMGGCFT